VDPDAGVGREVSEAVKPILFSGEMVRAILEGRKTQTRRVVKPQPEFVGGSGEEAEASAWGWADDHGAWITMDLSLPSYTGDGHHPNGELLRATCPYGEAGDGLWVRESFAPRYFDDGKPAYRADFDPVKLSGVVPEPKWTPSIHMPRSACRIHLDLVEVRIEQLQDITTEDIVAEGIQYPVREAEDGYRPMCNVEALEYLPNPQLPSTHDELLRAHWAMTWDKINAKRQDGAFAWDKNPWVWALTFKRAEGERDGETDQAIQADTERVTGVYPRGATGP